MGDLALCEEWIGDLGRAEFEFGFVIAPVLARYIDAADAQFWYSPSLTVGATIAAATDEFRPEAVIIATNAFWTIPQQPGATFGEYPPELFRIGVPVMSFDPFEGGFAAIVEPTGRTIEFPAVPPSIWSLRFMSRGSSAPRARHFATRAVFDRARETSRMERFRAVGADPSKRTVIFPISRSRHRFITGGFPGYYAHLCRIFQHEALRDAQFLIVSPRPMEEFVRLRNAIYVPHLRFHEFLGLVAASDVYLSDSLISSMITGLQLAVPVLALTATPAAEALAPGTFLQDRFFPYKVFPYGLTAVCDELVERFEVEGCFLEAEVLDVEASGAQLARLLFDECARRDVAARCRAWRAARETLPGPRATLDEIVAASSGVATA